MGQSAISFPILGGIEVNENGFDQSSDFPHFVPDLNKRNHVPLIQFLCQNFNRNQHFRFWLPIRYFLWLLENDDPGSLRPEKTCNAACPAK
jgi:hypothetical protein